MKLTGKFFAFICLLAQVTMAGAQVPTLSADSAVKVGKLENGLTYYIRHNAWPEHRASFYIVQKVGSLQEEDNQRGLAHFLEHMCFNGTQHFPGNSVIRFCESFGASLGVDLQATTSIDRTNYYINNVPTERQSTLDSCLLVLQDWASALTLDPQEIDKERGVIHEEWRLRSDAASRMFCNSLPALYPGSKYGQRYPIGTMEVVDNFKHQELRDYYEKWYHPSNQCIIVVGDIDVAHTEATIQQMFGSIKNPEDAEAVLPVSVPDNEQPIIVIDKDKEQMTGGSNMLEIMFKRAPFPRSQKNNVNYLATKYILEAIHGMMAERFEAATEEADCPYTTAEVSYGEYIYSKTKDCLDISVTPKGADQIAAALKAAVQEVRRAADKGFNQPEFDRFKASYLTHLEDAYANRDKRENQRFCEDYQENFLAGEPIPSEETFYALMKEMVNQLTVEQANAMMSKLVPVDDRNTVVISFNVEKEGTSLPTQDDLLKALTEARTDQLANVEEVKVDGTLIKAMPKAGTVTADEKNEALGYRELTLSNGVKVVLKKTDFKKDEVLMMGAGPGGSALYGPKDFTNLTLFDDVIEASGLGGLSASELKKALSGKKVSASLTLPDDELRTMLSASARPADVETMLQLTYLYFTNITKDEKAYNKLMEQIKGVLQDRDQNPQMALADSVQSTLCCHNPRFAPMTVDRLATISYDRILQIAKERTASAEGWTFTVVGNYDETTLVPLLCQYLGALPAARKNDMGHRTKELPVGEVTCSFQRKMETPSSIALMVWNNTQMPYTCEHSVQTQMVGELLTMEYLQKIREEQSIAYTAQGIGQSVQFTDGSHMMLLQAVCPMQPDKCALAMGMMRNGVYDMLNQVDADKLEKVKKTILKSFDENQKKNAFWLQALMLWKNTGVDVINPTVEIIQKQTPETIKAFMTEFLAPGNQATVVMLPQ